MNMIVNPFSMGIFFTVFGYLLPVVQGCAADKGQGWLWEPAAFFYP